MFPDGDVGHRHCYVNSYPGSNLVNFMKKYILRHEISSALCDLVCSVLQISHHPSTLPIESTSCRHPIYKFPTDRVEGLISDGYL